MLALAMAMAKFATEALLMVVLTLAIWRLRRFVRMKSLDKLPGPPSASLLTGNMHQLVNIDGWGFHEHILEQYGTVMKVHGFVGDKKIYTTDPKAIYDVLVKNHNIGYRKSDGDLDFLGLIFGPGLLATKGDQHRMQRKMMTPVFNVAHMKYMTKQFYSVTHRLVAALQTEVAESTREVELLKWMTRTALELIGQAGLGYEFDQLAANTKNEYAVTIKKLNPAMATVRPYQEVTPIFTRFNMPGLFRALISSVPIKSAQNLKHVVDVIDRKSREIYREKQQALADGDEAVQMQVANGKDIMSILLRANDEAHEDDRLPEDQVLAQMSTLVIAAMDTTSGALSHILQLLADRPEYQEKMRQELYTAQNGSEHDLSYEVVDALPLLDACCRETLRLFPPVSFLSRTAQKDMVMPLSNPVTAVDGTLMREIVVPQGTAIFLSIFGVNRSKAIWGEDALEWKPERWLKAHPQSVTDAHVPGVYSNLMTFGAGPTSCIGFKFSQLEMKVVLSLLLQHFTFASSGKKIKWHMGAVQFPCVEGSNDSQMPLRMTRISPPYAQAQVEAQ